MFIDPLTVSLVYMAAALASVGINCCSTACQRDLYQFIGKCKLRFQMFQQTLPVPMKSGQTRFCYSICWLLLLFIAEYLVCQ